MEGPRPSESTAQDRMTCNDSQERRQRCTVGGPFSGLWRSESRAAAYGWFLAVAVVLVLAPGLDFCCSAQEHSGRRTAGRRGQFRRRHFVDGFYGGAA